MLLLSFVVLALSLGLSTLVAATSRPTDSVGWLPWLTSLSLLLISFYGPWLLGWLALLLLVIGGTLASSRSTVGIGAIAVAFLNLASVSMVDLTSVGLLLESVSIATLAVLVVGRHYEAAIKYLFGITIAGLTF